MLLDSANQTSTNCMVESKAFSIKASPIAFDILSSRLYANPVLAICRELLTNGYDSHKLANKLEVPIKVHFPDYMDKNFSIRDFGVGLSKEDVMEMYTTFFDSTKATSNDFTGCFGLGSKTPFSYAPAFSVNGYWNGTKYYFAVVRKDGYPSIINVREEETDEPNGLEVIIPTDNDIDFLAETTKYLKYIPEILIDCNKDITRLVPSYVDENFSIYEGKVNPFNYNSSAFENILIKQGQNVYPITEFISALEGIKYLNKILRNNSVVLEVPIGTLGITPSRESLSKEQSNTDKIKDYILKAEDTVRHLIESKSDVVKALDKETYEQFISEKYFDKENAVMSSRNDDELNVKIIGSNVDYFTTSGKTRHYSSICQSTTTLVIATDLAPPKEIQKIRRTLINHEEEIDNFYMIYPHRNDSLLQFVRRVKNIVFILNSMYEYQFDITLMNLNQFYKKYPNHKLKREKKDTPDYLERSIYIRKGNIDLEEYDDRIYINYKHTDTVKYLHSNFSPDNTIVIQEDKSIQETLQLLSLLIHKIKDKQGNNFVLEYLRDKGLDLWMNEVRLDSNQNKVHPEIRFLIVAKSNIQFFKKNYVIFNPAEFYSLVRETDWKAKIQNKSNRRDTFGFLIGFKEALDFNFLNKYQSIIQNSSLYRQLTILIRCYNEKALETIPNLIDDNSDVYLLKRNNLDNKIESNEYVFWMPKTLQSIYKEMYPQLRPRTFRFKNEDGQLDRTSVLRLTESDKLKILSLIKGEKKNVLLQG